MKDMKKTYFFGTPHEMRSETRTLDSEGGHEEEL